MPVPVEPVRVPVLDSTPLYDAAATMDTVTLVRSAIRGLLRVADADLEPELRGVLCRDDDYAAAGKPVCDYDDPAAREALVDALARDARACSRSSTAASSNPGPRGRRRCWRAWSVRTSTRTPTECSGSPAGSRRTGSSPPSTPRPGTGTRPQRGGSIPDLPAKTGPAHDTDDQIGGAEVGQEAGDETGGPDDTETSADAGEDDVGHDEQLAVYGDAAYG